MSTVTPNKLTLRITTDQSQSAITTYQLHLIQEDGPAIDITPMVVQFTRKCFPGNFDALNELTLVIRGDLVRHAVHAVIGDGT